MSRDGVPDWVEINRRVEAYEAARAGGASPSLAAYLPDHADPLYLPVLTELVRVDMEHAWQTGRPRAEDYLARFPELGDAPEALREILREEFRQRQAGGERPALSEYQARFGGRAAVWLAERGARSAGRGAKSPGTDGPAGWDFGSALGPPPSALEEVVPDIGSDFAGFRLLAELGRGAFSRVFLARQADLAGRLVALKVTPGSQGEPEMLARLQHTNVVPVFSLHHVGHFEVVCMPYFGATTLQHVLKAFSSPERLPASAAGLLSTIRPRVESTRRDHPPAAKPEAPEPAPPEVAPTVSPLLCKLLGDRSYADGVVWLGARLADGLAHAHERGVLHLDLKPANVLLSDDGQPMLLDFNLSRPAGYLGPGGGHIGGTLPYMAPEHLEAFLSGDADGLDGRTDVYALGVILFQLLTARHPFAVDPKQTPEELLQAARWRGEPPRMRPLNRAVSPVVEAVVRKCLANRPADRYPSARALAEDLQRQFDHQPLRHVREPSVRESFRKWRRRHPRIASASGVAALACCLLLALTAGLVERGRRLARAEGARTLQTFRHDGEEVRYLLHAPRPPRDQLEAGVRLCRENLARYRALDGPPALPSGLAPEESARLSKEVGEQLFLLVRASRELAGAEAGADRPELEAWLAWNQRALGCYGGEPPAALLRQRAELLGLRGETEAAREWLARAGNGTPTHPDDLYLAASERLAAGKLREALPLLEKLLAGAPQHFWGWVALGFCHSGLGEERDAVAAYTTAVALRPEYPWPHYLRGLSHLRLRQDAEAERDFGEALARRPDWSEPWLSRAIARQRRRDFDGALADLGRALEAGTPPARAHAMRARLLRAKGDAEGAKAALAEADRHPPKDELSWVALGLARLPDDPAGALRDFGRALAVNPACQPALQDKAHVLSEVLGRPREALAVLDRVLELYPDYRAARGGRAVLLARLGDRDAAHRDAERCLAADPEPIVLFQAAGVYALTSAREPRDADRALDLLGAALRRGCGHDLIATDRDLDPIRARPGFRRLLEASQALRERKTGP